MAENSSIHPGVYRLLEVFRGELESVRFPDIDRDVLEGLAADVVAQHERLEVLRAEVASAEQRLVAAQSVLLDRAREALAYARLYAERHPELTAPLDSIRLDPRPKRGRKPRKPRSVISSEATESADVNAATESVAVRRTRSAPAEPAPLEAVG